MPSPLVPRSTPRKAGLGAFACAVLACIAAPPLVRGAADSSQLSDGGGCNGGRNIPLAEDPGETSTDASTSTGMTDETNTGEPTCGDGNEDPGEGCDDGNDIDEDACPSGAVGQCQAAASCGDGIVWTDQEECDGSEGCTAECTQTPAECGNGTKEAGEACDDGNEIDEDACPSGAVGGCKAEASCGDGITWTDLEACDDGNTDDTDACPSGPEGQCLAEASCGDGFVWADMEGCDDANTDDTDACPSGAGACKEAAKCGDGYVQTDVETCDDMNAEDLDECNNACASPRWVFVTSGGGPNINANFGGVAGADAYCQMLATTASLPGTYMAWLTGADSVSAPVTRFASIEFKGWYLQPTDPPTPVALGWTDLTSPNEDVPANYLQSAIHFDESGIDVIDASAWSNTNPDGTQRSAMVHCNNWEIGTSMYYGSAGLAEVNTKDVKWSDESEIKCNLGLRLYCFQVD